MGSHVREGEKLPSRFLIMSQPHKDKLAHLAVHAYLVSTNPLLDRQRRADCIEFLHELSPNVIELNYEGNKFTMPLVIFNVLGIIRSKSELVAYSEWLNFFPEFGSKPWALDAMKSELFKLDNPSV